MPESTELPSIASAALVHVRRALQPLAPWLDRSDVVEIVLNRPGEIWVERLGHTGMERHNVPELDAAAVRFLAERLASFSDQAVSAENPLLSATLPTGERFQAVLPPAAPNGGAFAIRKQVVNDLDLDDFERMGVFEGTAVTEEGAMTPLDAELCRMLEVGDKRAFIECAVKSRISVLLSGGTSTGKTTALNALLKAIPESDRVLTIEDTRELHPPQPNFVPLVATKGEQGVARVTAQSLLEASLRLRPDRIILGEIRGAEAFSFLQAINSGHPGSLSTVHADSPRGAYEQLALKVMISGAGLGREEIIGYIRQVPPIVIQLTRDGGVRRWSEVYFSRYAAWRQERAANRELHRAS